MTSGVFEAIPIESIIVERGGRQRKELTDIEELAQSISQSGLIHPLIVTKDHILITGERRLSAVKLLGWTRVTVQYVEDLTTLELQMLELVENISRVDLPWKDKCLAIEKYHNLCYGTDPDWSKEKTGQALNLSRQTIADWLLVAGELQSEDTKIADTENYTVARGVVKRKEERKKTEALRVIADTVSPYEAEEREVPLILEDFLEWAPKYRGGKFNFIHCDFPYGIGADKIQQGSKVARLGEYEDDPKLFWKLLKCLTDNLDRLVEPSAHIMFWFPINNYQAVLEHFTKHTDFKINPYPLVWHKSDNAGVLPDYRRGPRRTYETAFIGARDDRKIVNAVSNSFSTPTTKLIHMSEKPIPLLRHFFRMFVDEYSHVLDPTCGSGNAIKVAQSMEAKSFLGIEKDEDFFNLASEHFYD